MLYDKDDKIHNPDRRKTHDILNIPGVPEKFGGYVQDIKLHQWGHRMIY